MLETASGVQESPFKLAIHLMNNVEQKNRKREHTQLYAKTSNMIGCVGDDSHHRLQRRIIASAHRVGDSSISGSGSGCSNNKAGDSQEESRDKREDTHCERVAKSDRYRKTGVYGRKRDESLRQKSSLGMAFIYLSHTVKGSKGRYGPATGRLVTMTVINLAANLTGNL